MRCDLIEIAGSHYASTAILASSPEKHLSSQRSPDASHAFGDPASAATARDRQQTRKGVIIGGPKGGNDGRPEEHRPPAATQYRFRRDVTETMCRYASRDRMPRQILTIPTDADRQRQDRH